MFFSYPNNTINLDYKTLKGTNWSHIINLPLVKEAMKDRDFIYLRLNDKAGEGVSYLPFAWPKTKYDDLKKALRGNDGNVFVIFDSIRDGRGILSFSGVVVERFVFYRVVGGKKVFWGEDVPINVEDDIIDINCAKVKVVYNHQVVDFYFPIPEGVDAGGFIKRFKNGSILKFSAMKLEKTEKIDRERIRGSVYLVNEFSLCEDNYHDVSSTISKIKSISDLYLYKDFMSFKPIYCDVVNRLILYNVLYVRSGEPVFNLVLSGAAGCGKSWTVDLYTRAFGKVSPVSLSASISTAKGFIPNFGEKKVQPGMLLEPHNFVKGIQEMFRGVCSGTRDKDKTDAIGSYLTKFMNVIERTELIAGSGYGNSAFQFRDSLFATDNLVPDVRVALSSLIRNDTALIRRVSYLWLDDDAIDAVRKVYPMSKDDYMDGILKKFEESTGITIMELRRFGEWFRKKAAVVEVDGVRCQSISDYRIGKILKDIVMGSGSGQSKLEEINEMERFVKHMVNQLNLRAFFIAMVQCNAVIRCVIDEKNEVLPQIKVIEEDYKLAEVLFDRLWVDSLNIAKEGIFAYFGDHSRGISRTMRSFL